MDAGPGLKIQALTRNHSEILLGIQAIWDAQPVAMGELSDELRIYPAGVFPSVDSVVLGAESGNPTTRIDVIEEDRRLILKPKQPIGTERPSELLSNDFFAKWCTTWQTMDLLYYGGRPVDRFVFQGCGVAGGVRGAGAILEGQPDPVISPGS